MERQGGGGGAGGGGGRGGGGGGWAARSVVVGRSLRIRLPCGGARRGARAGAVGQPVSGTRSRACTDGCVERRWPIPRAPRRLIPRALTEQEAVNMSSYPGDFPIPVDEGGP